MGICWNHKVRGGVEHTDRDGIQSSWTFWLFAGTGHGRIMAWKIPDEQGYYGPMAILSGHECPVISLGASATRFYSGSLDKTIRVWDLKTIQCVQTLSKHKAAITYVLCWGEKLLSCSLDKTVKIWAASESGDL